MCSNKVQTVLTTEFKDWWVCYVSGLISVSWHARGLFKLHYRKQTRQIRCEQWAFDICRLLGQSVIYSSLHTPLTAEVESLVSESAFSTSPSVLSLGVFFLLLLGDSFPFLAFLFGEPTFPTSHLGHRTCEEGTVSINLHLVPLWFSLIKINSCVVTVGHVTF